MGSSFLNIGVSGLNAAQAGLLTTSHNIANAATPGFNRQQTVQTTAIPQFTGAGFLGQGTSVETVKRIYNQFLTDRVMSVETRASELSAYAEQIKQIDDMLADPSAGLSPALQSFFGGVQDLSANPAQIPSRQSMLSSAQALVGRFQALDAHLEEIGRGVGQQITSSIAAINSYAKQIAELNQRIALAQASGMNQPPNDLLDQRDLLLSGLNKEIRVSTTVESDGSFNVFVGNGQPLVVGSQNFSLVARGDEFDPTRVAVGYKGPSGTIDIQESLISGGTLGGLLAFRRETLDPAQSALGRVAIGLAQSFNDQHRLGQDLNGALGGAFFAVGAPVANAGSNNTGAGVVSAQIISSDYRVTYAGGNYSITRLSDGAAMGSFATLPRIIDGVTISLTSGTPNAGDSFVVKPANNAGQRVIAESDNTGSAVLDSTGSNVAALTSSDYRLDYNGANYTLTRLSDAVSFGPYASLPQTVDGVKISITGVPNAGDSFLIQPTRNGARDIGVAVTDPRAVAAALPVRTSASLANAGSAQISAGGVDSRDYLPLPADVTLTYNGATNTFTVGGAVPAAGAITFTSGQPIHFNGLSFTITGTPSSGDVFTLSSNGGGVSDNRNALALAGLQTRNLLAGSTVSYQGAYSQLVSDVGNKAREIDVTSSAQDNLVKQAQDAQQSLSGVNLDEEAANLIRYQQAYQASGMVFDTGTGSILRQTATLLHSQQHVASGRRILSPSDGPVEAARALDVTQ